MTKPADDLEAVRVLVETLQDFEDPERERIIRWAREKLDMASPAALHSSPRIDPALPGAGSSETSTGSRNDSTPLDIKSFVSQKGPQSDVQLAAVVAYFYEFVAPANERKNNITADDLIDACRKADRRRPSKPAQTMVNAFNAGFLDKAEKGAYHINSVGENLVAMVLPGATGTARKTSPSISRKCPGTTTLFTATALARANSVPEKSSLISTTS